MKFLILTQYFAPEIGASQVRLGYLCRELKAAGHGVEIVTAMPHHPAGQIFPEYRGHFYLRDQWQGLTVHRVWLFAASGSNLKRLLSYASFTLTCLLGMARAERPDYIFVDSPPLFLGVSGWIAAKSWNVPLIFNVADLWPDSVRDLGIMKDGALVNFAYALERWIYGHSAAVTAVTEGIRNSLLNTKRLPAEKVLFLPNGVDTALFRPGVSDEALKQRLGLAGKKIILYAGNHGYAGAVETVLYAAQQLRRETSCSLPAGRRRPGKTDVDANGCGPGTDQCNFSPAGAARRGSGVRFYLRTGGGNPSQIASDGRSAPGKNFRDDGRRKAHRTGRRGRSGAAHSICGRWSRGPAGGSRVPGQRDSHAI